MQWAEDAEAFGADPRGGVRRIDAKIHAIGQRGGSTRSRSSGGLATTVMPTCMQWARGREEFGADPRGELQKKEQWNNPNDMRAQRGAQTDFGAELPQKAIGADVKKQPDLSTSVSMGACPKFQHVRKKPWFQLRR